MNQLSEAEKHRMLVEWNATAKDVPPAAGFHQLIEQRAVEMPGSPALICRNQQLTYEELDRRANQVASYLCKLGVGAEVIVGISVDRSLDMVVGLLGVLKAGGAYLPLDPHYPPDRLSFMIQDARIRALLTQDHLLSRLPIAGIRSARLDADWQLIRNEPSEKPTQRSKPSDLAYVIYTSGSSGKPKGVMVEHRNVLNFFAAMNDRVPHGLGSTWLAVTSPSFDISVLELFWTLSRGFKVVIYAEDQQQPVSSVSPGSGLDLKEGFGGSNRAGSAPDPSDYSIPALVERHAVTHLQCTPSMASMLLLDERAGKALGRLETLLIGGEAFPAALARQLGQNTKGTILNMYGPTETTVWSTTYQVPQEASLKRIPVGRPIANTQIYIVDDHLQPVAMGAVGELLIGGAGVARGYLGREPLTAERFIPDPFASNGDSHVHVYRTGDLARYLADGNIELLGRMDQQVKIRGHRVELDEIEHVLNQHPAVREAVVLLRELSNGDKALVAYFIPRQRQTPAPEQLRIHLRQKLPEHMVPSHFILMTAFPQTPNRKVDRNAFPPPDSQPRPGQDDREEPVTDTENALAAIWKEVLGIQRVGRHDNFFEMGGQSMRAMQLVARVQVRLKVDLTLRNVFERQTLAGMAEIIEALAWSKTATTRSVGRREVIEV